MKKLSLFAALLLTGFTAFAQDGTTTDGPEFGIGFYLVIIVILVGALIWALTRNRRGNQEGYNQQ